ncbi:MAG: ABC transporter substrate-binding protein [Candidatus Rokuibacteriota bacterium]
MVTVAPPAPARTVKVGILSSVTGPLALLGHAGIEGARLAVAELNAAGGVLGHRVDLLVRDDTGRPEVGARQARDAIVNDEVALLLGPVSSAVLLSMSEVAKEHRTILISHTANSERAFVEQGHRYVFSVVPNTFMEGNAVAQYLAAKPFRRYAVLGPDYELGHTQGEAFERRLRELRADVEIVDRTWPKLGATDFSAPIAAISAARPDAVYSNLFGSDLVEFTRQAKAAGLFDTVAFVGLYDVEVLQALGKDAVEGIVGYERGPFHVIRALAPSERFEDFIRRYGAATNRFPSTWAINAYDAVMAWGKAVQQAGALDTEQIVDALEGLELDSLRGPGRVIRKADHQANVGTYIGVVAWDERFPDFAIWKEATYIPGDQVWRPEAEVPEIRRHHGG